MDGRRMSVRTVEKRIPPITTVARGRCTSEPRPEFTAIGKNPIEATSAVITTGLSRDRVPSITRSFKVRFGRVSLS